MFIIIYLDPCQLHRLDKVCLLDLFLIVPFLLEIEFKEQWFIVPQRRARVGGRFHNVVGHSWREHRFVDRTGPARGFHIAFAQTRTEQAGWSQYVAKPRKVTKLIPETAPGYSLRKWEPMPELTEKEKIGQWAMADLCFGRTS